MGKSQASGKIVAVGGTVDFARLDDPAQTNAALIKAVEEVHSSLLETSFSDRNLDYQEKLPELLSRIKDLHLSIDFLRTPTSTGKMPSGTDAFQVEVAAAYRTLSAFLSFPVAGLSFTDWCSLSRSLASLDISLMAFIEQFSE